MATEETPLGLKRLNALREAHVSEEDISLYRSQAEEALRKESIPEEEIRAFFGDPKLDTESISKAIKEDKTWHPPMVPEGQEGKYNPDAKLTDSIWGAFESGLKNSSMGLAARGELSDIELKPGAGMAEQFAQAAGMTIGDLVPGIAGAVSAGAFTGAAVSAAASPLAGIPAGAAAAAFTAGAVPAGIRKLLTEKYRRGEVKSAQEFSDVFTAVLAQSMKEGAISLATMGAGQFTGKLAKPLTSKLGGLLGKTAETGAKLTGEALTMGVAGPAVEGRLPEPEDFTNSAVMVLGLHTTFGIAGKTVGAAAKGASRVAENMKTSAVAEKLRVIYEQTGMTPDQVSAMAEKDPFLHKELLLPGKELPESLKPFRETEAETKATKAKLELPESLGGGEEQLEFSFVERAAKEEPAPKETITDRYSATTPEELSKMSADEANKIVRSQIKTTPEAVRQPLEIVRNVFDEYDPILKLQKEVSGAKTNDEALAAIKASDNPYILFRNNKGVVGKTIVATQYETFDFSTLKKNGESLANILKQYKNDPDKAREFENFLSAARSLELAKRGIEGLNEEATRVASQKVYEAGLKKFGKDARRVVDFQSRILKYAVDAGIKSPEEYQAMLAKGENYVPFQRVIEGEVPQTAGAGLRPKDPLKEIKGSKREIISPIESIIRNTNDLITMAERNRGMKALKELFDKNPEYAEVVEKGDKGKEITLPDGEKAVQYRKLEDNEVAYFENGKRTVFKVSEDVAKAINGTAPQANDLIQKLLSAAEKPAQTLRRGVTFDLFFTAKNITRDQLHAFIMSNNGYIPVVDYLRGAFSLARKDEAFVNWMKGGGMAATIQNIDRNYLSQNIVKLQKETGFMKTAQNAVRSKAEILSIISELGELPTRIGEFKKSSKGRDDIDSIIKASYDARNITLDFQKRGAITAAVNSITPFLNARLQGNYQLYEAIRDKPGQIAARGAVLSAASLLLWAATHDDERYKQTPQWQKDLFWIVPVDKWVPATKEEEGTPMSRQRADGSWEINLGKTYKIPKNQELGMLFSSVLTTSLDAIKEKDPEAVKELAKTLLSSFLVPDAPLGLKLPAELATNYSFFYRSPIVDHFTEQRLPHLQYNANTTSAAKMLSEAMFEAGIPQGFIPSPAKTDYAVRGVFGTLGGYGLTAISQTLQALGAKTDTKITSEDWNKISWVRAFQVRMPEQSKYINEFYDIQKNEVIAWRNSYKRLEKIGDEEGMIKMSKRQEYQIADYLRKDYKAAADDMKTIRDQVASISKMPDEQITREEKDRAITSLLWRRAEIARAMIEAYKDAKKTLEAGGELSDLTPDAVEDDE